MVTEEKALTSFISNDNSNLASISVNSQNIIAASTLGLAFPMVRVFRSSFLTSIKLTPHQVHNPQYHVTNQRRHNRDILDREQA